MSKAKLHNTSYLKYNYYCKECNWPVLFCCVNDEFCNYEPAKDWDWFLYCTNKGCQHHVGEGIFQDQLDWVYKE